MKEKSKTKFVCQSCGYESIKWLGQCPDCRGWNTLQEEISIDTPASRWISSSAGHPPVALYKVTSEKTERTLTNIAEFDRVLGGGLVKGSLVLIGGEPGIGKSTLLLQAAERLAKADPVLYVSGEESVSQIRMRAERLGKIPEKLFVVSETNVETIMNHISKVNPVAVIIDSIQTVYRNDIPSAPGSVSQVRESAGQLMHLAKTTGLPIFFVGHVTKEGAIAGPRVLEHLVDTVLYFEGDHNYSSRLLRAHKNRFGSTNEVAVFEMTEQGLREVENPSEIFLAQRAAQVSGSVVVAALEGTRPLLVELQALVSPTRFGMPQRRCTGVDYNRFILMLAVLEKKIGLALQAEDVFVSVSGGVSIDEPAADLGIVAAAASSFKDKPVDPRILVMGEVGLGGEARAITQVDKRLSEAARLGFCRCFLPSHNLKNLPRFENLEIIGVNTVQELLKQIV